MAELENKGGKSEDTNLFVGLRIRPMSEDEIIQGATPIAHKVEKNMVVLMDPSDDPDDILRANRSREKNYTFDMAFDGAITQEEVYESTSKFLIPQVIAGYNGTVFAYGATGAGKTYTMLGTDDDPGIMARTLTDLFRQMEETKEEMSYEVSMSYLEIYNELIRDLLNPQLGFLDVREDSVKGVQIAGLSEIEAKSTREVMDMLFKGNKARTQEPTAANKTSSRSHAILQVNVKQCARLRNVRQQVRCGKLFLIDLAGSERAANTHNIGKRMVEGAHINRSLLALGNCINALSDKNGAKYINYRDSKLTRLLKDALGGNCKTVMIAHLSPASLHFEESRNTLAYADRAKQIKTKVRKNVMDVSYHITQYTNIIAELREEVKRLHMKLDIQTGRKNASAIHAIQYSDNASMSMDELVSEVMQAAISEDNSELSRLKEHLLMIFTEQMEFRRSLMDLNNNSMEISLELARNQLLVQKWEREKALRRSDVYQEDENGDKVSEKERELAGTSLNDEPDEVRLARDEIGLLLSERDKAEHQKTQVMKDLDNCRERATRIQEVMPRKITSAEQQEILSLLCKVHELEIENMEMQASCLLRNFELRRKDMILAKHRQHHALCHEIITQQRTLMSQHDVKAIKELDELLALYQQEVELDADRPASPEQPLPPIKDKNGSQMTMLENRKFLESHSMSDLDRDSLIDADTASIIGSRILVPLTSSSQTNMKKHKLKQTNSSHNLSKLEESEKVFSRTPKAHDVDMDAVSHPHSTLGRLPNMQRQPSILTLSSRSEHTASPPPDNNKPSPLNTDRTEKNVPEDILDKPNTVDHKVIANKTRNIAALAAQRKHVTSAQTGKKPANLDPATNTRNAKNSNYLTTSRLAHHDSNYGGSTLTLNQLIDASDNVSIVTNGEQSTAEGNRNINRSRQPLRSRPTKKSQAAANRARKRRDSFDYPSTMRRGILSRHVLEQSSTSSMAGQNRKSRPPITNPGLRGGVNRKKMSTDNRAANPHSRVPLSTHNQSDSEQGPQNDKPIGRSPRISNDDVFERSSFGEPQTPSRTVQQNGAERGKGLTVTKRVRGRATNQASTSKDRAGRRAPPTVANHNYRRDDFGITGQGFR